MKLKSAILLFLLIPYTLRGQNEEIPNTHLYTYNILFGGLVGGIGSAIHKNKEERAGKAFIKGFVKGSIGGGLNALGKDYTYKISEQKNYWYAWGSKLIHATGSSIIENSARNQDMLSNWAIDIGPIRLDVGDKTRLRIQPFATLGFITACTEHQFNPKISLMMLNPYFNVRDRTITGVKAGVIANTIMVGHHHYEGDGYKFDLHNVAAHELIHTFQYREFMSINHIYLKQKSRFIYWDIPLSSIPYGIGYMGYKKSGDYYSNYYEAEAHSFATRNPTR